MRILLLIVFCSLSSFAHPQMEKKIKELEQRILKLEQKSQTSSGLKKKSFGKKRAQKTVGQSSNSQAQTPTLSKEQQEAM